MSDSTTPAQIRGVIERLIKHKSVVSRATNEKHEVFPVAVSAEEGVALQKKGTEFAPNACAFIAALGTSR